MIFFNRVPKVGSQTFMELLRRLSIRNGFHFYQDRVQRVETIRLAPEDQAALASIISSYEQPGVYIKHVCFTNFTEYVDYIKKKINCDFFYVFYKIWFT